MYIGDVASHTGIHQKTIHHYIQLGLLHPSVEPNGYYRFSEEEVATLQLIHRLRLLSFSLEEIGNLLSNARSTKYYMVRRLKDLANQRWQLDWQADQIRQVIQTGILEQMERPDQLLLALPTEKPEHSPELDENDATMLCTYFWGTFMKGLEMTEYRRYLWSRLVAELVAHQDPNLLTLRDYIFQLSPEDIDFLFFNRDERIQFFVELQEPEYPAVSRDMAVKMERKLNDPAFVRHWKEIYPQLILPAEHFFSGESFRLMSEFTPRVERFQTNIFHCCDLLLQYLTTAEGTALCKALRTFFAGDLALNMPTHSQLATLYLFS